ncbi:MAG: CHAT domain-containing protein [Ardenticatenaceae bacterium]
MSQFPKQTPPSTPDDLGSLLNEIVRLTDRSDMPRRVELCQAALALVDRHTQPELWGLLQNERAFNLWQNPLGKRADNLEQAISALQQTLQVYTRQAFPEDWANSMSNLAAAYWGWGRIKGERAENLELAIDYLKQGLEVYTRQAFPEDWARSMNNLAEAYRRRIKGERAENIKLAISHYKLALEVYTRQAFPYEWARSMNNLAEAYRGRIRGERAENIELAISHYKLALEVYTRQAFPYEWARSMNNLAAAYWGCIKGERAENLELAIDYLKQVLEVRTRQAFPEDWAASMNNLAAAYWGRIKGERAENIELAIDYLKQALEVYTRQAFPEDWANSMNNLAAAYGGRIKGERAQNIELAISCYEQALEVYTRQAFPYEWARSMKNLAVAYWGRIRGERAENLELAISHHEQALEVRTRQAFPYEWASSMNNLALAYEGRVRGERAQNIELAISFYEQALEVYTRQAFPEDWARSMNNLAEAYGGRIRGEHAENIELAISFYEQALEVYTRQAFPYEWGRSMHNLAWAYWGRIKGERAENVELAIECFQQALEERKPQSFPQDCRNTAHWLGRLLYDEGRFAEARQAFVTAHEAVEALRGEVVREKAKRDLAEENADLYARLVFCCLRERDAAAAFKYAVAGKGRAFVDMLATARFDLSAVGAEGAELAADLQQYRERRKQIDNLLVQLADDKGRSSIRGTTDAERVPSAVLRTELNTLQEQAAAHWEDMSFKYPALTATESAPTLSVEQAWKLSADIGATLVEYYRDSEGLCAFVVTPDTLDYVPLPQVNDELLAEMLQWTADIECSSGRNKLSYYQLDEWYEAVIAPLSLPKGEAVVLAPFGKLHLLPLAAARNENGRYVAEECKLAFAPSLGALSVAWAAAHLPQKEEREEAALLVAYPGTPHLPNVLSEAEAIARYFPQATPLHEDAATPEAVVKHAPGQQIIHLGCHGWFDPQRPQESGLQLAEGWLTVQRIITNLRLKQNDLTTLGACLSGKSAVRRGDEHVGLTQAIMTAGARTVVGSLWSVNDKATSALFEAFYARVTANHPPAIALRQAQNELRTRAHWKHPYYWAAFITSGLAHGPINKLSASPTSPSELSARLDSMNAESQQRGHPMNEERMLKEVKIQLKQMKKYHCQVMPALSPIEKALVLDTLAALTQKTRTVQSQADLLSIANAMQTLAEEIAGLRTLLIEEHIDIAQAQAERSMTLDDIESTEEKDQEAMNYAPEMENDLVYVHDKVAQSLVQLNERQTEEKSRRKLRLWEKLGLKWD